MSELDKAIERGQIAEAKLHAIQLEQSYRAIEDGNNKRKRRAPSIEMSSEDEQINSGMGRLKSIAKSRDIRRNYGGAKGIETQLWLNTVGTCPKIIVHFAVKNQAGETIADDAKIDEWSNWFNSTFAKRCDARGNRHLGDQARMAISAMDREGDILVYFDAVDIAPGSAGKLWYWEADQLPEITANDFKRHLPEIRIRLGLDAKAPLTQSGGVICDEWGRAVGYVAMKNHLKCGMTSAKFAEVTILPERDCMLLFNPWRMNQKRGISDVIETANTWQDLERFSEALLQRSIVQSYLALKVKRKDSAIVARDRATDTENPDGVPSVASEEKSVGTSYKNFEKLSMNAIEYVDEDEDVEPMQLSGDLPNAESYIEYMQSQAGWAQGLSRMYATGKANGSYSASMGENNMTWLYFEWRQKFLERYFLDWVAEKAFRFALSKGFVTPARDSEWVDNYSWHGWPKRRAINPAQEAGARKTDLSIGAIDYEDLHGPFWSKKLANLGKQIRLSRDSGFFSTLFPINTAAKKAAP